VDTPPISDNVNIRPPGTIEIAHEVETRVEEEGVYYPTIPIEIVQAFTYKQTEVLYDNLMHIYDNTSGGTIMAQNATK
jgi:hypothetical protein